MNNRPIKFRAWDKRGKRMLTMLDTGERGDYDEHDEIYADSWVRFIDGLSVQHDDNLILIQYTGLKDKNGKEIYEGDVIKEGFFNKIWKVEFDIDVGGFYPFTLCSDGGFECGRVSPETSEVIGNIYENPDLIK